MIYQIRCSSFKELTSSNKGTIINSANNDVSVENCLFFKVSSSSYPGCIYVTGGSIEVKSCYSFFCYAGGDDDKFSKVCHAASSKATFSQYSALFCGPLTTSNGDSVNVFQDTLADIIFYNASKCYGTLGSSSLSLAHHKEGTIVKYLNSDSGIDHNSFEIWESSIDCNVYFSNFINSTKNTDRMLHINSYCYFHTCSFTMTHSVFNGNLAVLHFENCTTDEPVNSVQLTETKSPTIAFIVRNSIGCNACTKKVKENHIILIDSLVLLLNIIS